MANSFSNQVKSSAIQFSKDSLISNTSDWRINTGTGTLGETITLDANSSCTLDLISPLKSSQVKYMKILATVDCNDKSISTISEHNLSICYTITFNDNKNIVETFYPSFNFEQLYIENIINNFSIIDTNDTIIDSINITIYNYYDIQIKIEETALYYNLSPVDTTYLESKEYTDKLFEQIKDGFEFGNIDLTIPLVYSLPPIDSVPDGAIFRLASIN